MPVPDPRARGREILFALMLSTMMLPAAVTIIPLFILFQRLHWLDTYHARVLAEIGPMLDGETLAWLEKATAPLPHDAKI